LFTISSYKAIKFFAILSVIFGVLTFNMTQAQDVQKASGSIRDDFYFGAAIHLGQDWNHTYRSPQKVREKLIELGVNATRDDLPWEILEAASVSDLPRVIGKMGVGLNDIDARPVIILKGDPKRLPGIQPTTHEERVLYTEMVSKAAMLLKGYDPIFEIWNEWNMKAREYPHLGSVEHYVELAKMAYPAIKAEMPQGTVLVAGPGDDRNWEWTLDAVRMGLMEYGDAISIHPYNYCSRLTPRTGWHALYKVKTLHEKLQEAVPDKDIPLYITEIGWPDVDGPCGGVPPEIVGENVAQILLEAPSLPWLKGVWLYELLDQGTDPVDREDHFGLYDRDLTMKPAACAAKTVWDFMADTSNPRVETPYWKANVARYDMADGDQRVAVWSMEKVMSHWVKFPDNTRFTPLCGREVPQVGEWVKLSTAPFLAELSAEDAQRIQFKKTMIP
jgi:hypothetical protein